MSAADTRQKFKLCRVPAVRHSTKRRTRVAPCSCFAECQGTRQSLCRVPEIQHSAKSECLLPSVTLDKRHSAKPPTEKGSLPSVGFQALGKDFAESLGTRQMFETLPSARVLALGKVLSCCPVEGHFAECIGLSTRQSGLFFFFCFFFSVFRYKYNKYIYKCRGHYRQL